MMVNGRGTTFRALTKVYLLLLLLLSAFIGAEGAIATLPRTIALLN